jgi:prepilin-type N-terminal cleavage/methylation domain-containing protein
MQKSRGRKGFTLPEVLVTLAIVATLAAVLLPALNSQLSKGDAGRGASDLVSLQTAIGAFASDIRRYPGDMAQLAEGPLSGTDILGNAFPSGAPAKWKGPYLTKSLVGGNLTTGFGATIVGDFDPVLLGTTNYLVIEFTGISEPDFNKIDEIIDDSASSSTGQLRWSAAASGTGTFYAVPLQ